MALVKELENNSLVKKCVPERKREFQSERSTFSEWEWESERAPFRTRGRPSPPALRRRRPPPRDWSPVCCLPRPFFSASSSKQTNKQQKTISFFSLSYVFSTSSLATKLTTLRSAAAQGVLQDWVEVLAWYDVINF